MNKVILRDEFADNWSERDAFDRMLKIEGQIVKAKDNRRVLRFEMYGAAYYLKHHVGVGWKEIIKNLLQMKLPVLGASNEWYAIERLQSSPVNTMEAVAFGQRGINPAGQESFLITKELCNTLSLEELCGNWRDTPPPYALKKGLVTNVAKIAKQLVLNGLNHRDFYLCHILIDISRGITNLDPNNLVLYLVDLHRMQIRNKVPRRWEVKDIGSIYFSSLDIGLNKRDAIRFIRIFSGKSAKEALMDHFWLEVRDRAGRLYRRDFGREPKLLI